MEWELKFSEDIFVEFQHCVAGEKTDNIESCRMVKLFSSEP